MNALRLFLVLVLALPPIVRLNAQSKTSDTLKRAGLLTEPNAKPPTISKQDGELIEAGIIARQTDHGRNAPAPAPGKPVYYVAYDGDFDSATAGVKPPPPAAVARTLRAALASAGYEPATAENRPAVAIVYRLQYGTLGGFTSEAASTGTGADTTLFSIGTGSAVRLDCTVTISAYDYQNLTRSEPTLLWVTQRISLPHYDVLRNVDETFLAFVAACGPYFGTSLPGDLEVDWVAVPRRADLTDRTPAFQALSVADPVLDKRAFGEMKRKEQEAMADITRLLAAANAQGRVRSDGGAWIRGLARSNASNPSARVAISQALARRIAQYLKEKRQLQETLAARTQGLAPGAAVGPVVDAFSVEHARSIAALTLTGEAIRRDVAQAMAEASFETKGKSLDVLLREFAAAIRASKSIPQSNRP